MFTTADTKAMAAFQHHQKVVYRRNVMLDTAPHICSQTVLRVQACRDEYIYTDPIRDAETTTTDDHMAIDDTAIVCDWRFTESGCRDNTSCFPFYPKMGVCRGWSDDGDGSVTSDSPSETAFSFVTPGVGQIVDTCQPVCYEKDAVKKDSYIGLYLEHSRPGDCWVADARLLAFYIDPHRRVIDLENEILEKSAYRVTRTRIGPSLVPALVARIDPEYCKQYDLVYIADGTDRYGSPMFKCELEDDQSGIKLSDIAGRTITRSVNSVQNKVHELIEKSARRRSGLSTPSEYGGEWKRPPTRDYLVSRERWLANVDPTKVKLPFPLHLRHLGIVRGTHTEWLIWTDEYSHLDDGRNDKYGGRLVEPYRRILTSARWFSLPDKINTHKNFDPPLVKSSKLKANQEESHDVQATLIKNFDRTVDMYKAMIGSDGITITLHDFKEGAQNMLSLMAVGNLNDVDKVFRNESVRSASVLRKSLQTILRRFRGRVDVKTIGFAASNAALRSGLEVKAVSDAARILKLSARTLATAADIINVLGLIGLGLDLFTMFIYDPWSRYSGHVSDRSLLALAEGELLLNQRTFGVQRVYMTPYDWLVNTSYLDRSDDLLQDMFLAVSYMSARRTNSVGSRIDWQQYGSLVLTDDGRVVVDDGVSPPVEVEKDFFGIDLVDSGTLSDVTQVNGGVFKGHGEINVLYVIFAFVVMAVLSEATCKVNTWVLAIFVSIIVFIFPTL